MAKGNKKERKMNFSLTPFLYGGFIVVCVTALLQSFIPAFPVRFSNAIWNIYTTIARTPTM